MAEIDADSIHQRRRILDEHTSSPSKMHSRLQPNIPNMKTSTQISTMIRGFTTPSSMSWLTSNFVDKSKSEDLSTISTPEGIIPALRRAVELNKETFGIEVMDLMTKIAEDTGYEGVSQLSTGGACSLTDQLFHFKNSSSKFCESSLRAICTLILNEDNRKRFSSSSTAFRIVTSLQVHLQDVVVVEWGLRVVRLLFSDSTCRQKLCVSGIADTLKNILLRYPSDERVVEAVCRVIFEAVQEEDQGLKQRFSQCRLSHTLLDQSLGPHHLTMSESCIVQSLRAVGSLARHSPEDQDVLAGLGICSILKTLSQKFDLDNPEFAESICWAIGNLSYPNEQNQTMLAEAGACTIVVSALEKHLNSELCLQECVRAIRNLCYRCDPILAQLRELGISSKISLALTTHFANQNTLQWVWFVISALAEDPALATELGNLNVCQCAAENSHSQSEDVVQWTAIAVGQLSADLSMKHLFGELKACKLLVEAMAIHMDNSDVVEECCYTLASLSQGHFLNREQILEAKGCQTIMKAFQKHEKLESTAQQCFFLLSRLSGQYNFQQQPSQEESDPSSSPSPSNQIVDYLICPESDFQVRDEQLRDLDMNIATILMANHVHKILPKILSKHQSNSEIAEFGLRSIYQFSLFSEYRSKLISDGLLLVTINLLSLHSSNLYSSIWGINAILILIQDLSSKDLKELKSSQISSVVVTLLSSHFTNSQNFTEKCFSVISNLSKNESFRNRLGTDRVCEAIVKAIHFHREASQPVTIGCTAIASLARQSDESKKEKGVFPNLMGGETILKLGGSKSTPNNNNKSFLEVGTCQLILALLKLHSSSQEITYFLCVAIDHLCDLPENRSCMVEIGVSEALILALRQFRGQGEGLVVSAITALGSLAQDPSRQAIQDRLLNMENALQDIASILDEHKQNSSVSHKVCRLVAHLADQCKSIQDLFRTENVCDVVSQIISKHLDFEDVGRYAAFAISSLARSNSASILEFSQPEDRARLVCSSLVSLLQRYSSSEFTVEYCCYAICDLNSLNSLLGEAGACEILLSSLLIHSKSESVSQWICRSVGSLAENQSNKKRLLDAHACELVVRAMQRHISYDSMNVLSILKMGSSNASVEDFDSNNIHGNAGIAHWGCLAIYYLTKGRNNRDIQVKMAEAGACEVIGKALLRYAESSTVALACLQSVTVLCIQNKEIQTRFGNIGVCHSIVETLHFHPSNQNIALWGCISVASLAERNTSNILKMASSGICESLPICMQSHQTDENVNGAGCDAIFFISEDLENGFAARFGHTGACEAVVSVLVKHKKNSHLLFRACRTLSSLARVYGNSSWFGPAGACETLLSLFELHGNDSSLCSEVWFAIASLCLIKHNRERLNTLEVSDILVRNMIRHQNNSQTSGSVALAAGRLCENSFSSLDFVSRPFTASYTEFPLETFLHLLPKSIDSYSFQSSTAENSTSNQQIQIDESQVRYKLFKLGCCKPLVEMLIEHRAPKPFSVSPDEDDMDYLSSIFRLENTQAAPVVESILQSIAILSSGDTEGHTKKHFGELGICEVLVKTIVQHKDNLRICLFGCLAIFSLSRDMPTNQFKFVEAGACEVVSLCFRNYCRDQSNLSTGIFEACCLAIAALAEKDELSRSKFAALEICDNLMEFLIISQRSGYYIIFFGLYALCHLITNNHTMITRVSASDPFLELLLFFLQRFSENKLNLNNSLPAQLCLTFFENNPKSESDCEVFEEVFAILFLHLCSNRHAQQVLGTNGACKFAVSSLQKFERNPQLSALFCMLISALSRNCLENKTRFGALGAARAICSSLERFVLPSSAQPAPYTSFALLTSSQGLGSLFKKTDTHSSHNEDQEELMSDASIRRPNRRASLLPSPESSTDQLEESSLESSVSGPTVQQMVNQAENRPSLTLEACSAIVNLSQDMEANRARFATTSVTRSLTSLLDCQVSEITLDLARVSLVTIETQSDSK